MKHIFEKRCINVDLKIDWDNPLIEEGDVLQVKTSDLDNFYIAASDFDKSNLFFVLLNSYHCYLDKDEQKTAAHLSFLIAYYLFITLTPPGSCELAMHYIKQAISLHPLEEYSKWLILIEKGN